MMDIFVMGLLMASAIWVCWDASNNKIGKTPSGRGMFNMSAGAWGLSVLLFWVVALPAYLMKRKTLIRLAESHPVISSHRLLKSLAIGLPGGLLIVLLWALPPDLPSCESSAAVSLLQEIVNDMPLAKRNGIHSLHLKNISEQKFNPEAQTRFCRGTLVTNVGEDEISYLIHWADQSQGEFYIQFEFE